MSFGDWMRERRKAKRWSLRKASDALQITSDALFRIEKGKTKTPQAATLERVVDVFGEIPTAIDPAAAPLPELDDNTAGESLDTMRIPLFDRNVAAGPFLEPDDLSEEPDGYLVVPRFKGINPADVWALRISGDSMAPLYPSGSRVILARVRYYESDAHGIDCKQVEPGRDYYVCLADGRQTFKRVVEINRDNLTLQALNVKRFPKRFVIPCQEVVNLSRRIGVLDPE